MKRLLGFLFLLSNLAVAQTMVWTAATNPVRNVSHSTAAVYGTLNTTASSWQIRILIREAAHGACTGGTSDWVVDFGSGQLGGFDFPYLQLPITGLTPSTTYNVCVTISSNGGAYQASSPASLTVTTLALPSPHPALPIPPTLYDPINYLPFTAVKDTTVPNCSSDPHTNTYCRDTTLIGNCNITTWKAAIDAAFARQGGPDKAGTPEGTIISLAGTLCTISSTAWPNTWEFDGDTSTASHTQWDWHDFGSSALNTNGTITWTSHGLTEGHEVVFGFWAPGTGSMPTGVVTGTCKSSDLLSGALSLSQRYYAHIVDSNHIQLTCGDTLANGATVQTFSSVGTMSGAFNSRMDLVPWPSQSPWIIIDNGLPDDQFVPYGTRPSKEMGMRAGGFRITQQDPNGNFANRAAIQVADPGSPDTRRLPYGNVWFRGLQWRFESPEVSVDPASQSEGLRSIQNTHNIVLDRAYWYYAGVSRVNSAMSFNGNHNAIINSRFENGTFWSEGYLGGAITSNNGAGTVTIAPVHTGMGPTVQTTTSVPAVITMTGSGTGTAIVYTSLYGGLSVQLPPGITATCTGPPNLNCATADTLGGTVQNGTVGVFPNTVNQPGIVMIDPVYSSASSCLATENIWGPTPMPQYQTHNSTVNEWGTRFRAIRSGFVCGIRFYKPTTDTLTTHTVNMWSSSGTNLATKTTSGEATGVEGWITATLTTPIAVTAGTIYVVSYGAPTGAVVAYEDNYNRNAPIANFLGCNRGSVQMVPFYTSNPGCDIFTAALPANVNGRAIGVPVACFSMAGANSITTVQASNHDSAFRHSDDTPGFFYGYMGSGPFSFWGNWSDTTGNTWHFDGSGHRYLGDEGYNGGDINIRRNYFLQSMSRFTDKGGGVTAPQSDASSYGYRQALEFKDGQRVAIHGNVFDGSPLDVSSGAFLEMTSVGYSRSAMTDFDIYSNLLMHGNAGFLGPSDVNNPQGVSPASLRARFYNNLLWDISGVKYHVSGGKVPRGDFNLFVMGVEDWTVDHNTMVGADGAKTGAIFAVQVQKIEGMKVTNNIFPVNASNWAPIQFLDANTSPATDFCGNASSGGQAMDLCIFPHNFTFAYNVLQPGSHNGGGVSPPPSDVTQAQVQAQFPTTCPLCAADQKMTPNYYPANGDTTQLGFRTYDPSLLADMFSGNPGKWDFHLKTGPYLSSGTSKASDGSDEGADVNKILAEQGVIETYTGIATGATTGQVYYLAPDSAVCTVDVTKDPFLLTGLKHTADGGGNRSRLVNLSGLTTATTYYYRIGCMGGSAYDPPTGQFTTQ